VFRSSGEPTDEHLARAAAGASGATLARIEREAGASGRRRLAQESARIEARET